MKKSIILMLEMTFALAGANLQFVPDNKKFSAWFAKPREQENILTFF